MPRSPSPSPWILAIAFALAPCGARAEDGLAVSDHAEAGYVQGSGQGGANGLFNLRYPAKIPLRFDDDMLKVGVGGPEVSGSLRTVQRGDSDTVVPKYTARVSLLGNTYVEKSNFDPERKVLRAKYRGAEFSANRFLDRKWSVSTFAGRVREDNLDGVKVRWSNGGEFGVRRVTDHRGAKPKDRYLPSIQWRSDLALESCLEPGGSDEVCLLLAVSLGLSVHQVEALAKASVEYRHRISGTGAKVFVEAAGEGTAAYDLAGHHKAASAGVAAGFRY